MAARPSDERSWGQRTCTYILRMFDMCTGIPSVQLPGTVPEQVAVILVKLTF